MSGRSYCCASMIALAPFIAVTAVAGDHDYQYYDFYFPDCPDDPITEATDINDTGILTGYFRPKECGSPHGLNWVNGVMFDLDVLYDESTFLSGEGISTSGSTILGLGTGYQNAIVLVENEVEVLSVPLGCEENEWPKGMNKAGTMIAGQCERDGGYISASVYWIETGEALMLELFDDLPFDATGEARDVNDDGVVIGIVDGEQRSFMWQDGVLTEIFNGIGGEGVTVHAINNHGLIVGTAETASGLWPAISYDLDTGDMTILGDGYAAEVNDRGSAVGRIIVGINSHAVLYENLEVIDLHEGLLDAHFGSSWTTAINNYGWIIGWGYHLNGGVTRGWLLVPIYDKGDYDADGDVDLQDFGKFQECFAAEPYQGPEGGLHVGCSVFDFDDDVDLDLTDYAAFQKAFTGPTAPDLNPYGPG